VNSTSLRSLRLVFKRAFATYYFDLCSPVIADPTESFAAAADYLGALHAQLGSEEFMRRLDDETTHLAGEVEQDLRRRLRDRQDQIEMDDLEDRLRECLEFGVGRIHLVPRRSR